MTGLADNIAKNSPDGLLIVNNEYPGNKRIRSSAFTGVFSGIWLRVGAVFCLIGHVSLLIEKVYNRVAGNVAEREGFEPSVQL